MFKRWLTGIIAFLFLFSQTSVVWALAPFKVSQYVTDQAGLLSSEQTEQFSRQLYQYAKSTGNQLLVITVPSLEDREAVEFTEELYKLNQPGQKSKDNGLILFIAQKEHKIRIEVGYGLEESVPDGKAGTIIREVIRPQFQKGDYPAGISAGINALIKAITPDFKADNTNQQLPAQHRQGHGFSVLAIVIGLLIAFFSIIRNQIFPPRPQGPYRRYSRGYSEPSNWGGGFFPGTTGGDFFGGDSGGGFDDDDFKGGGGDFGGGGAGGDW